MREGFRAIEIVSPVELQFTDEEERTLIEILTAVCDRYEDAHPGRVCWVFGFGHKMTYVPLTADEEQVRGCEFDETVLSIEIAERQAHPQELERRARRRSTARW